MILNKLDSKKILNALYIAIDTEESVIDAHRTGLKSTKNGVINVIPREYKKLEKQTKCTIKGWKKLIVRIESELK